MKRIALLTCTLLAYVSGFSQTVDTLSLSWCYQQVEKNYPLSRQTDLLSNSSRLRISNLNKNYLPQVNFNANASLQSEVTELTITPPPPIPPIEGPKLSKDWYKLTFDVNQVIFDGNNTSRQKQLETASLLADQKNIQVEIYKLKDRVNQIFFSIFFLQKNEELLLEAKKAVESKLKEVKSAVDNGILLSTVADALSVEMLRLDQQLTENRIDHGSAFKMLGELISMPLSPEIKIILPEVRILSLQYENLRLENQLFDLQKNRIDALKSMVIVKWNPKFSAFGQLGFGRPGLNMLSDDFGPWWIFGGRFTWNLWNWNQNSNDRQILDIQSDIIQIQQQTFDKNLRITAERDLAEIMKVTEMLKQDDQIIRLREKITLTTSSQIENGTVTSSEYVSRLNEELQAKISKELHQIQLVKAKQAYLYTIGKL